MTHDEARELARFFVGAERERAEELLAYIDQQEAAEREHTEERESHDRTTREWSNEQAARRETEKRAETAEQEVASLRAELVARAPGTVLRHGPEDSDYECTICGYAALSEEEPHSASICKVNIEATCDQVRDYEVEQARAEGYERGKADVSRAATEAVAMQFKGDR